MLKDGIDLGHHGACTMPLSNTFKAFSNVHDLDQSSVQIGSDVYDLFLIDDVIDPPLLLHW